MREIQSKINNYYMNSSWWSKLLITRKIKYIATNVQNLKGDRYCLLVTLSVIFLFKCFWIRPWLLYVDFFHIFVSIFSSFFLFHFVAGNVIETKTSDCEISECAELVKNDPCTAMCPHSTDDEISIMTSMYNNCPYCCMTEWCIIIQGLSN